jgi:hypothetical protein
VLTQHFNQTTQNFGVRDHDSHVHGDQYQKVTMTALANDSHVHGDDQYQEVMMTASHMRILLYRYVQAQL